MKLSLIQPAWSLPLWVGALSLASALAVAGCSSRSSSPTTNRDDGNGAVAAVVSGQSSPHPLGVIALGESHEPGAGTSITPFVSASFVSDAAVATACTETIAGCTVPKLALCDGQGGPVCGAGEVCALDSSCEATCQTPCTAACGEGEACYFAAPGVQACRADETFNAGTLTFAGTTAPIALAAPYAYEATTTGALALPGARLEVHGAGAAGNGFGSFDATVTATTPLQTSPSLATLKSSDVWGDGALPVGWVPGHDAIVVSVLGRMGMAQCAANDAEGAFEVPRAVIDAVLGSGEPSMTVSVTRQHTDRIEGVSTRTAVPAVGSLEVSTSSTESFSFEGATGL
jgi:hypothetical protein